MSNRPLNEKEKWVNLEKIREVEEQIVRLQRYITMLKEELLNGVYSSTPEEDKKTWEHAEQVVREDKDRYEANEIKRYGRVLTHEERLGWVQRSLRKENK